jgi:hypothetical protein
MQTAKLVTPTSPASKRTTAPKRIVLPSGSTARCDIRHGVIAYVDGNARVQVIEGARPPREVTIGWRSPRYATGTIPPDITGLRVMLHDGQPVLAVTWQNALYSTLNPATDGPGLGVFRLDGTPIAIDYFYDAKRRSNPKDDNEYDFTKLLDVNATGRLVWKQGYTLTTCTIADLVAGRAPDRWPVEGLSWAALDDHGRVYANQGVAGYLFAPGEKTPTKIADRMGELRSFGSGVLDEELVIADGTSKALNTRAWMKAIDGKAGTFTLTTVVGKGDVLCVGPGSFKNPHLCFVQRSTGKILGVKKQQVRAFSLFLDGDTLYVFGSKQITAMAWPHDGRV